jgi:hypothetical protein
VFKRLRRNDQELQQSMTYSMVGGGSHCAAERSHWILPHTARATDLQACERGTLLHGAVC